MSSSDGSGIVEFGSRPSAITFKRVAKLNGILGRDGCAIVLVGNSRLGTQPPITDAGLARYAGILAAGAHEVLISGSLPKGETTRDVTYSVVDGATKAVLSQVILPDASNRISGVRMLSKVERACDAYEIGTFASSGEFEPVDFLSVRSYADTSPPSGARGRIT